MEPKNAKIGTQEPSKTTFLPSSGRRLILISLCSPKMLGNSDFRGECSLLGDVQEIETSVGNQCVGLGPQNLVNLYKSKQLYSHPSVSPEGRQPAAGPGGAWAKRRESKGNAKMRREALRSAQKPGASERLRTRPRRTESTREGRRARPGASWSLWGRGVERQHGAMRREASRGRCGSACFSFLSNVPSVNCSSPVYTRSRAHHFWPVQTQKWGCS